MRRTILPIFFALLFACGNLWAGGLFPGTGGGGGAADEITYDNSTSGLSATNLKDAIDEVTTMAGTGGLASVDDLPGDTVDDTKIDVGLLPTGTTSSTVSLGNHTHASLYQPLDTDLTTWAGVTPSANGQALVAAANYAAMRGLLDLEAGTDFNAYSATLNTLSGLTLTGNSKYIGTNSSGVAGVHDLPSSAGMVYPGAGVPNSTGSAWGTSYTVGTSANNLVQLNGSAALPAVSGANLTSVNAATLGGATFAAPGAIGGTTPGAGTFTTLSAGASGFGVNADGNVTVKSLTVAKVSGTAGTLRAYEANSTDTSTVGWMGPASISASWDYQFSSTQPAANSIMLFGAPSSNISAQTWATLDDTGTNGDTAKIWSADKCYDQLALKANTSHNHSGNDITSGVISIERLPVGTSGSTVALGNHTHSSTYAALSHYHSGSDITSGTVGPAYLPLNSYSSAGIVSSSGGYANMVWKTDASGNPGWRADATGGGSGSFDAITTGTNTSATMTLGTGGTLTFTGSGIINASRFLGVTSVDATEFGYLDGVTSAIQTQLNAKASSSHTHAASAITSGLIDNARINWAEPSAIGGTTPAAGTFTTLTANSLTLSKTSGSAGDMGLYEANSTDTDGAGFRGPASLTANTSYRGQFPNARPTSDNMVLVWAGTAGSGSGTPASPYIHAMSFVDLDNYVTSGGALGTPSGGTLTNCTGLPISTGLNGAGTGVLTALGNAVNASGGITTPDGTATLTNKTLSTGSVVPVTIGIACSDESTALTIGTAKATFRMPHAMTLTAVRASVGTAPAGSTIIVDINEGGSTIMTTNKLSIDASEKTSTTAATAAGITDSALADDAEITIDIDQIGSSTAGAGLKIWLIGKRTL